MASVNQSVFNPGPGAPLATPDKIRRLEKSAATQISERKFDAAREGQFRASAQAAARSWKLDGLGNCPAEFEKSCQQAFDTITEACDWFLKLVTNGSKLSAEAKPLLDNSFMLRMSLQESQDGLKTASRLPLVEDNRFGRVPRAWALADSYLHTSGADFDETSFACFTTAAQEVCPLNTDELWVLKSFLQFALLEQVGAIASTIIANKAGEAVSAASRPIIEGGARHVSMLVRSLSAIADLDWKELFEKLNQTDRILRNDPVQAYAHMDFESRESYRKAVAELARNSDWAEHRIAQMAITLAEGAERSANPNRRAKERRSHVGFYLIDKGRRVLEQTIGYRPTLFSRAKDWILRGPHLYYIVGIELITLAIMTLMVFTASKVEVSGFLVLALFLLPAAECAVSIMNYLSTSLVAPHPLPKLDYSKGIPSESATMVAIPMLLMSKDQVRQAVRDLEIRYLANPGPNLHFALITDVPDSMEQFDEKDKLAPFCAQLIDALNIEYSEASPKGSFFLFHRHRAFNPAEGHWMGWERKRGKLLDFNSLLLGQNDAFPVKAGDLSILKNIKYVITLDLDTQLPRDAARKLVGTMAHPLNRAVIDPATNTVAEGYGILQPRVEISIQSARRSRLASLFSGDTGFDIYTRAISDVYQDLFGEATYAGKGIYEVATFQKVLKHRFPCNALLSHDMIEGAYARAGLVSDIGVIDDYPSHFSAFSRRKHRWVRGDWQIMLWLLPRVPDYFGQITRNPIGLISRWKIIDNLRRSLTELATFLLFVCGWLVLPGKAAYWTIATLILVALPTYFQFALSIAKAGRGILTTNFWKSLASDFGKANATLFFRLAFLCHQSLVMLDAVVRTLVRMAVTHTRLLEWETAAEAEMATSKRSPVESYLDWTVLVSFAIGVAIAAVRPSSLAAAFPLLLLWGSSKLLGHWLNQPAPAGITKIGEKDYALLHGAALRTWRFFREYSNAEENWLIPDIVDDNPPRVAHRTSTTNIGMLLNARQAALDLGYLTAQEFVEETERTFDTLTRMPKHNGHLFNWYNTQTLEAIKPRFISTVDNGNLLCSLWTLKSGCLELRKTPLFRPALWTGVQDHAELLHEVATASNSGALVSSVDSFVKQIRSFLPEQFGWLKALPKLEADATALEKQIADTDASEEVKWWAHEICMRLTNLNRMVQDFAPWLLPQFDNYCNEPGIQCALRVPDLTLESAAAIHAELDSKLRNRAKAEGIGSPVNSALQFLRAAISRSEAICQDLSKRVALLAEKSNSLANDMDFEFLYNPKKQLLSIGYEAEEKKVSSYYYDILSSEARAAYFVAIARGDIPQESWFQLQRSHTIYKGVRVPVSWTGTMFEYLMPSLWMRSYPDTLIENGGRAAVRAQQKFTRGRSPWGISECACAERNPDGIDYRYHAFGVPGIAFNGGSTDDLVISPYSTFLALMVDAASAVRNLRRLKNMGCVGPCGFYEAADFTRSRIGGTKKFEVVRTWMAHHQGMSFVAAANILCDSPMQRRFHAEPMVEATERLLHEKVAAQEPIDLSSKASSEQLDTPTIATAGNSAPIVNADLPEPTVVRAEAGVAAMAIAEPSPSGTPQMAVSTDPPQQSSAARA